MFSRTIYATRLDLQIAFLATIFCFVLGVLFGVIGGYFGGLVDQAVGRIVDLVVAFPSIVAIIALIGFLGNTLTNLYIALTVTGWTAYARLSRGEVLAAKNLPYVSAARALGYSHRRIVFRHLLPNVVTPAGLFLVTDMVATILLVTSLSYLGLGPQPPTPEWGAIIAEARPFLLEAWWVPVFPGLAIILTGVGLAFLGDGLGRRAPSGGALMALLEVRDLVTRFEFHRDGFAVVDGVSLEVGPGETVGIVGESGSGKSLTLRSIVHAFRPRPP